MERRGGEHGLVLSPPLDGNCSGRVVTAIRRAPRVVPDVSGAMPIAPRPDSRPVAER